MDFKEFKPSSLAIDNGTSIYLITVLVVLIGIYSYISLPKEQFPEVDIPTFTIVTAYAGASPKDVENLITRPVEQELKSIDGVDDIKSISKQATSVITVEFKTSKDKLVAQQEVNDAVETARTDLPQELTKEPAVNDLDPSDQPILNINLSGNFDLVQLKKYADEIQDEVESLQGINEAEIVGALEQEIQINVDLAKMQSTGITFNAIRQAVASKNVTISAGGIDVGRMERSVRVDGKIDRANQLENLVLKNNKGKKVYLKDIAEIKDGFADRESYARLNGKPVITLNVRKQSGSNLIEASDLSREAVNSLQKSVLPSGLHITFTGDRSDDTRENISNLFDTVIIGFLFVVIVLMFIMGIQNAVFVGLAIPLSTLIAFAIMPSLDFSINMVVLFSLILGLGIVVDDAIVIVENIYRFITTKDYNKVEAAKRAAGEIASPIIAGTLTTVAPFVPLLFWGGIIGKFIIFLPITILLTLMASMIVALFMNPVFAVSFMSKDDAEKNKKADSANHKSLWVVGAVLGGLAGIFYLLSNWFVANLLVFMYLVYLLAQFVLKPAIARFNESLLPRLQQRYYSSIEWIMEDNRPWYMLGSAVLLLVLSGVLLGIASPKVVFFAETPPNFVYVYNTMPVGTDLDQTNAVTKEIENRIYEAIGKDNPNVKSVISNVAVGAAARSDMDKTQSPNKSKISIAFVKYDKRTGNKTTYDLMEDIRNNMSGIPGAEVTVEQEESGPPVGKPINIEISGDDYTTLSDLSNRLRNYIQQQDIPGIEGLKSDLQSNNPETVLDIDNVKANSYGISNAQLGNQIRTALLGSPISTYRRGEDEYDVTLRLQKADRSNVTDLMNMEVTTPDGKIPISAVADIKYTSSVGSINRIDLDRVITLSSNVLEGYNANKINADIRTALKDFQKPDGYAISLTGEQEEQADTLNFLLVALLSAVGLIFLILVTQFNSIGKPLIIMSQIIFSLIGVFLGFSIFGMSMSVVLTGMGIIAVAGIVVKNGIILIDFIDILREEGHDLKDAIIEGGATRLNPVLLTAASTILGLIPLAIGLNIDFYGLFAHLDPNIYFGGDNAAFWGALAWTIIFGLAFATFLTLFLVPSMYYIGVQTKSKAKELLG